LTFLFQTTETANGNQNISDLDRVKAWGLASAIFIRHNKDKLVVGKPLIEYIGGISGSDQEEGSC